MSPRVSLEVWVTGIGLVTPFGLGVPAFTTGLAEQRSGLRRLDPQERPGIGDVVAGVVPDIDPLEVLSRAEARCVDQFVLMALTAADEALRDSGVAVGEDVAAERVAAVISSGAGGLATYEEQAVAKAARGRSAVSPYLLPGMLPNMAAARIAIRYGIRGVSSAIATACASGAMAVAEGLRLIREGAADVVVCGGADTSLAPSVATSFRNARALARGDADDDPVTVSRFRASRGRGNPDRGAGRSCPCPRCGIVRERAWLGSDDGRLPSHVAPAGW
jgi:3-oxoacyl-[acyl-carrier-protein] synthase II